MTDKPDSARAAPEQRTLAGAMSDVFSRQGHSNPLQPGFYSLTPFYALAIVIYLFLSRALAHEERAARSFR